MIVIVDPNDSRAVRNKDNVLALYDLMINQRKSQEATSRFVSPAYIQHNPLIADGPVALGKYFGEVTRARANPRAVVHRIIAVGDYVPRWPPKFPRLWPLQNPPPERLAMR
jgi:predicted SnoaL-like aldol condensation-catalyzing enzyme